MSKPDTEAPLSDEDVRRILAICSPHALLVGGQALAFWADHLSVEPPATLADGVTADADFIGDAALAKKLGKQLGWRTWIPSIDDATPQTGKVTQRLRSGGVKQVDFWSGVAGLSTKDLMRRAIDMDVPDIGHLRVLHPIDVLDSRIQNLHLLPQKRNRAGIAQAHLAIGVARAFIRREIAERGERKALKLLERVAEIAQDMAGVRVHALYAVDPLSAIPLDDFRVTSALHKQRWPRIVAAAEQQRSALKAATGRRRKK